MPYLSSSQKDELLRKMRNRTFNCPNRCSAVGASAQIGDIVGLPVVEKGVPSGVVLGNQFVPAIPIICGNCGAIAFFSIAGLVDLNG